PLPALTVGDVSVNEGNSGTTALTFTVSLAAASGQTVTVNYATADGTATAGSDYEPASGTLSFAPGQTSKTITANVLGDTTYERNEPSRLNLSGATGATLARTQAIGTIVNDDALPSLTVNNAGVTEGNSGTTPLTFTVSLSNPSYQTITVNYATADNTAAAGS